MGKDQRKSLYVLSKWSSSYRGPSADPSGDVIKMQHTEIYGDKKYSKKYIERSSRKAMLCADCMRAPVQGLKESRLTIGGVEDQGLK